MCNSPKTTLSKHRWLKFGFALGMCFSMLTCTQLRASEDKQNLQDVRDVVKQFLMKESTGLPGSVTVEVGTIDQRRNLTSCEVIEPYLPSGSRLWGKVNVGVRCAAPQRWSIYIPCRVKVTGNYYVSAKTIMRGQTLTETDIAMAQGDLTSMSGDVVTDPSQAIGHTSTMSLGAGIALRQDSLRLQQVVMQGQTIRLVSNGNGFKVSTDGQALNSASQGQLVKVKINSGQVLSGTAKLGGIVEVNN